MSQYSPSSAIISLNATPTPERFLNLLLQSSLCKSTTAQAFGNSPEGIWWSVTTVSIPSELAYATSCAAAIPLSTVIMSFIPRSLSLSTAFLFIP